MGPSSSSSLQRIKEALKQGRSLIAERQKLIRIIDRSEHCSAVVNEYTANKLADDSGDGKRIEKAEKAAEQMVEKSRKKHAKARILPRVPPASIPSTPTPLLLRTSPTLYSACTKASSASTPTGGTPAHFTTC